MTISRLAAPNRQSKLRSSEVLHRFFTLASVASLALSLWAAPYYEANQPHYEANQPPGLLMGLALHNAIGICSLLVFLQLMTGLYLAVRDFEKPADRKRLVFGTLLSLAVFWANLLFGVAGPFLDSRD
jgi:hypothetical protein